MSSPLLPQNPLPIPLPIRAPNWLNSHRGKRIAGAHVVVVGLGISGEWAAKLARLLGANVTLTDNRKRSVLGEQRTSALEQLGVNLVLGTHDSVDLLSADLVVLSPGVVNNPWLSEAERRGAQLVGELEFASWYVDADIAAIGGTNGKSTTTELTAAFAATTGKPVFAGGNLGTPLAQAVATSHPGVLKGGLCVLEVSAFQMERSRAFRPKASVLLNITPDHLDRYHNMEAYAYAKARTSFYQEADDVAIVPFGDEHCRRVLETSRARIELVDGPLPASIGLDDEGPHGRLVDRVAGLSVSRSATQLKGRHNITNICAAWATARALGADVRQFQSVLQGFEGLPHRCVHVGTVKNIAFYDDSKGTNVGAAVRALVGMKEPYCVLIAGGKDKGGSYAPLVSELKHKGRALVVLGEAKDTIASAVREGLGDSIQVVSALSMKDAVHKAFHLAREGDAVLLSPACASFDMFRDYAHRGAVFTECVRELIDRATEEHR